MASERRAGILPKVLVERGKGARKTKIMYDVRLSFSQLQTYLKALNDSGLIAENSGVWHACMQICKKR
jgi:predicted transcriptional regulator